MDAKLLKQLSVITAEEQEILAGRSDIDRDIYMQGQKSTVNSRKLLSSGKLITIRPHTRFIHFPEHTHDYVEVIYMCNGETTHIVNGKEIKLEQGDLLFLNQSATHEVCRAEEKDIAVNFIVLPEFFSAPLSMIGEEETPLRKFLIDCLCGQNSGAGYLYFDVSDLSLEELPAATMLMELLGKLPTAKYSSAEIQMLTKQKIGKLNFDENAYDGKKLSVQLNAHMVCLANQKEDANALLCEILNNTNFDDIALLKNLLNQTMMHQQMVFVGAGHRFASIRASAMATGRGAAEEALYGSTFIQWVKNQCAADDAGLQVLAAQLKALAKKAFCVKRMTVGVSDNAEDLAESVIAAFPAGEAAGQANFAPMAVTQVGLPIPAPIGFAAKASNIKNHGGTFNGSTYVLANILRFSYLWNEIRVQGGAYGCGFSGTPNGDMYFHTYRDPQPGRSLDVFDKASEFIRNFCAESEDLTPMILGAFSAADPLLNTQRKIATAETRYFTGTTYEDTCRISRELVETTKEDLLALTEALEQIAKDNAVCVVAGQPLLDACGEKLVSIQQVL